MITLPLKTIIITVDSLMYCLPHFIRHPLKAITSLAWKALLMDGIVSYSCSLVVGFRLFMGDREGNLLECVYKPIPTLNDNMSGHTSGPNGFCTIINHAASSLNYFLPTILTSGFRSSGMLYSRSILLNLLLSGAIVRISVDSRRGFLWTLSANSHLTVYQYDIPGTKTAANYLSKLASLTASDLAYRAASVVRSVDRSHFSKYEGFK